MYTPHKSNDFKAPLDKFSLNYHYDVIQIKDLAYWSITRKPDSKLSVQAVSEVLVGYTRSGYVSLNPESGKFFESRNVRFNKKIVYGNRYQEDSIRYWRLPESS